MTRARAQDEPRRWGECLYPLVLLALCGLLYFGGLGLRGLWETDEARYAEIGREMVESGDWITPRLNYVKYFEKPILSYWLVAGSFKIFGFHDWTARLTPAVFGTLTVLLVFLLGRSMWEARSGFWSALLLAISLMFLFLSQVLLVDMVLCFGVVLAIYGAWELRGGRRWGMYAFWAGCAVGLLTKGLLGPGLPAMVVVLFALLAGEWPLLRALADWRGPVLFLALCAPWLVAVSLANPEFPEFFFIDQNFGRLLTTKHQRYQPFYYYLMLLPAALIPWVQLLPWAVWQTWPGRAWRSAPLRPWLLAAVWFVSLLLFLSASQSKMIHYTLPMLPPLALLTGRPLGALLKAWRGQDSPPGVRHGVTALAVLVMVAAAGLLAAPAAVPDLTYDQVGVFLLIIPLFLAALSVAVFLVRRWAWAALGAPLMVLAGLLVCAGVGLPRLDDYRAVKALAAPLAQELGPADVLVSFGDYFQGLAYYAGRRVVVADNWGELDFGRRRDPQAALWFLPGPGELADLMASRDKRVVALAFSDAFERFKERMKGRPGLLLYEWGRVGDKTLFANRPR